MFGGRPGFRWWRRPSRVFIHTTDTHRCACKFRTLGNAREADDGKRGTRVAIMLAWKSWKRGPEGQPLLPTFRVQTIAICLLAAGVMQRAPTAIRCHRAASESYKQTACLRFSFPLPSSSLFLSLSLSLSLLPPRPLFQADRFGTRWRTAKTRSTFIPPNLWTFEKFFSTLEFTAGLETRAAGGGIIIVGCEVHADAKLCKFLTPRRDEWRERRFFKEKFAR